MEPCLLFCCFLGASQQRAEESPPFGEAPQVCQVIENNRPAPSPVFKGGELQYSP